MKARDAVTSLAALAQESRLHIYRLLVEAGPTGLSVGEIGASLRTAPATLSFHLKELFHAGLIASRQQGRFIFYSANYARMNALLAYLTENCCAGDGVGCATGCGPSNRDSSHPAVESAAQGRTRRVRRATTKC